MNKELRKAIYTRSRFRSNFWKSPTKENEMIAKYKEINAYLLERKVLRNICTIFHKMVLFQIRIFEAR